MESISVGTQSDIDASGELGSLVSESESIATEPIFLGEDLGQTIVSVDTGNLSASDSGLPPALSRPCRVSVLPLPLIFLGLLAGATGVGASAFWRLLSLPPLPNCTQEKSISAEIDQLYCAEQAVRAGEPGALLAGLRMVKAWSGDSPLLPRAHLLAARWSEAVLTHARLAAEKAKLADAIALAKEIPANVPAYQEAQAEIAIWEALKNRSATLEAKIMQALKQQQWGAAEHQIEALSQLGGQANGARAFQWQQRLRSERRAFEQLQPLRQFVKAGNFVDMSGVRWALQQIKQIPKDTYVATLANQEAQRIVAGVAAAMTQRLRTGNLPEAVRLARAFPPTVAAPSVVRDILWYERAQTLSNLNLSEQSLSQRLFQLWAVIPQLRLIKSDSPLYGSVTQLLPQLEAQLQDLTHLHAATAVASKQQVADYRQAIQLAEAVALGRPLRIQAQTLIARWQKDLQYTEDSPLLRRAEQAAAIATPTGLKAGIELARQIPPGRVLRQDAEAAIARWTRLIQIQEDRPALQQAQALAQAGKLQAAIQLAQTVRSDRALYPQAQQVIQRWTGLIQTAEDRPILTRAQALADQGALGAAINVAAQIAPKRVLYGRAQGLIGQWSAQIEAIRQAELARQAATARKAEAARQVAGQEPAPGRIPRQRNVSVAPAPRKPIQSPVLEPPPPAVELPAAEPEPIVVPTEPVAPPPVVPTADPDLPPP